jgi:putative transcriptional regulator
MRTSDAGPACHGDSTIENASHRGQGNNKMTIQGQSSLKGQFIIAMPGLMDPNFHQTVTLICEHNSEGAMGIIIDRGLPDLKGERVFKEVGISFLQEYAGIPVYFCGPVHIGEIFVLHGPPFHWEECLMVNSEFGLSNTTDILEAIAMGKGPLNYMIAIGCSGWGSGQLENEMMENAWLTDTASSQIVFNTPMEQRWNAAIENLGIDPGLLSGESGHA